MGIANMVLRIVSSIFVEVNFDTKNVLVMQVQQPSVTSRVKKLSLFLQLSTLIRNSRWQSPMRSLKLPYLLNNLFSHQNLGNSDLSYPIPSIESLSGLQNL